jgi:hypothetical protein
MDQRPINRKPLNQKPLDLMIGVFLVIGLNLGFLLLFHVLYSIVGDSSVITSVLRIGYFWIGITQFIYLIPAIRCFRLRGRLEVVKGIVIGAILTILINGSCAALLYMIAPR